MTAALLIALALAMVASGVRSEADAQTAGTARYTVTDLGILPGGWYSEAHGINGSGQVVGESSNTDTSEMAFLWENGQMRELGTLGGGYSTAYDISDSGQAVGYADLADYDGTHAFLWEDGRMKDLGASSATQKMRATPVPSTTLVRWSNGRGLRTTRVTFNGIMPSSSIPLTPTGMGRRIPGTGTPTETGSTT